MASLIALAIAVFSRAPSFMIVAALLTITNALAFRRHLIMIPHEVE